MKNLKLIALTFVLILLGLNNLFSQSLPNNLTEKEKLMLPTYVRPISHRGITLPPSSPVRNPAEWEEMDGICISWQDHEPFLSQIVKYATDEGLVYIFCSDSNTVKTTLTNNSVALENTRYIQHATTSVWIRDYGVNNIYTNDVDSLLFVDWIYNRPRPEDDESPQYIANLLNIPMYETTSAPTDLVNTGGNFMSDGFGNAFASKLILDENASGNDYGVTVKNETEIDAIFNEFMGITNYVKLETLPYDGIHHIDMHMKLLDEETILVGEFPTGESDGPQIEENIQYIADNCLSVFGTPYKIVRIPMPPDEYGDYADGSYWGPYYRTYTNSLIINKTVLVPTYYTEYDTTALRIYREAMPGYRVIGIDANEIIPLSGTIHCTTHEIATSDPLLISHQELNDVDVNVESCFINAKIQHRSGISLAEISYKVGKLGNYQTSTMTLSSAINNTWGGIIPNQSAGDTIYYYIRAEANSGKTQVRPIVAPEGNFSFIVLNSTQINSELLGKIQLNIINSIDKLSATIYTPKTIDIQIEIYDISGKRIGEKSFAKIEKGTNNFEINKANFSQGMYIMRIYANNLSLSKKFIISNK